MEDLFKAGGLNATTYLAPLIGRLAASTIYDIGYPLIQHEKFSSADGLVLMVDLAMDFAIMSMYTWLIKESVSVSILASVAIGMIDGVVDILQTKFIYGVINGICNRKARVSAFLHRRIVSV